ncbi:MAG: tRNA-dihydrouridine synthase [Anaerolineales bacterium]|nr:tRNA-dihydrouridine synthase [Anaerolineales bacterium]
MKEIQENLLPAFSIGPVSIYGDVVHAPMDGYTDSPFRQIARKMGSAFTYSEFLNALDVIHGHPKYVEKISFKEFERPIIFQLYDHMVDRLVETAIRVEEIGPDMIDINMGCSDRDVSRRGAGAGLLQEPQKIQKIFSILSKKLKIPLTGKIRLGWDLENLNYLEVSKIIEDNGGKMIAVHGRTRSQQYRGEANWEAIAEIKNQVNIPVIGNGDIISVDDISRMKAETGCDAVMIGRASIGNPWLFAKRDIKDVGDKELFAVITDHLNRMVCFYGEDRGVRLFRKHVNLYLKMEREEKRFLLTRPTQKEFIVYLNFVFENRKEN